MKSISSNSNNHSSGLHQQQKQLVAVELNIGGQIFAVSPALAEKFPNCRLAAILSGREATPAIDSQGRPFLDRSPAVFAMAVDFLRLGGRFLPPGGPTRFNDWERLEAEAEFLRLPELAAQLRTLQRDRGGGGGNWMEDRLEELLESVRDLQRPPAGVHDGSSGGVAFLEVGETIQAVFLEGSDPQRQLVLQGELGTLREILRKRCSQLMPRLLTRVDELTERRGRRVGEADIVSVSLPELELRHRGFPGGLDEFRLLLLREVARVALPGPPTQLTLPNGEQRLLFRVASTASAADVAAAAVVSD